VEQNNDPRELKHQRAREKYASILAERRAELNAKKREKYHRRKCKEHGPIRLLFCDFGD
jgi:hypothetical protein